MSEMPDGLPPEALPPGVSPEFLPPEAAMAPEPDLPPIEDVPGRAEMENAIRIAAGKAAMTQSAAEFNDFAAGCLRFAQAITVLDPLRLAGGDTPEARAAATPISDGDGDGVIGED
jgi:hypothetical protein